MVCKNFQFWQLRNESFVNVKKFSIFNRIIKRLGTTLNVDDHIYYAVHTPKQLNNAPFDELRERRLTLRKTEYIKSISEEIEREIWI